MLKTHILEMPINNMCNISQTAHKKALKVAISLQNDYLKNLKNQFLPKKFKFLSFNQKFFLNKKMPS